MIHSKKLSRKYRSGTADVLALDAVSFEIQCGERVSILGRSGSGKTTLLNLLSGLDSPSSGELTVDGQPIHSMDRRQLAGYRSNTVGVIFQSFQLLAHRTAQQNVELPMILAGVSKAERQQRAATGLEQVGLSHRTDHFPWQLSGGEQQRVAIARALANSPSVLLADEPTGNLDSNTADQVVSLLTKVCSEKNITLVLITHDRQLAETCCDRHLCIQDGRLLSDSSSIGDSSLTNTSQQVTQ